MELSRRLFNFHPYNLSRLKTRAIIRGNNAPENTTHLSSPYDTPGIRLLSPSDGRARNTLSRVLFLRFVRRSCARVGAYILVPLLESNFEDGVRRRAKKRNEPRRPDVITRVDVTSLRKSRYRGAVL